MSLREPDHFGKSFAGQVLEWMPTDTQERFEHLRQDPEIAEYFRAMGWHQSGAITYKINSHGFRGDEFQGGPYLITLGCSYTVGIGLPLHTIWPEIVGRALDLRVANLAWGGYSADTCFRLGEYWIPQLKPALVVMMSPPASRFELLFDADQIAALHTAQKFDIVTASQDQSARESIWARHWFGNSENHRLNSVRNRLAVERLCDQQGVRCITDTIERHMWRTREQIGYARDRLHGGPPAHRLIADYVLETLDHDQDT